MTAVKLLSDTIVFDGTAADRSQVRRIVTSDPVERPFAPRVGITRCGSAAPDVRELWERLLEWERSCGDGMLRGGPSTVLEARDATIWRASTPTLQVALHQAEETAVTRQYASAAVPRFTYALSPRKLRNISHWLLDCLPQVVALAKVASDATFLLPDAMSEIQRSSLALVGLSPRQIVPWHGEPTKCDRLLMFESDGRIGGGRPLSPLLELRRLLADTAAAGNGRSGRRIYVSRRDARKKRRWVADERGIEAVFQSRGFEILYMSDHRLPELAQAFRDAGVVAGINGAGLAHVLFSPPGTHLIVLFSDALIRWHADDRGARSLWASGQEADAGQLAALGDSPRFYAHVAAAFEQTCHSFVGGDEMPIAELSAFLDDVLMRLDRT